MADKILKSITFPNLPDKYIIPEPVVDTVPTQGSTNAVQSGGVWDALHDIDGTSSIFYSDHTLFVGDYDDPTKLYNLSDEDITRGYSVWRTATAQYPYLAENPARAMYTGWDLLLEPNKTYKVTATVSEKYADTAQMGINTYDQSALDAYAEEVSPFDMVAHSNDTGWQGLTVLVKTENTVSGEPTVAMRIVFRQDTQNTPISDDFKVHRITIEEVASSEKKYIYELTDSDFTTGKGFVFTTSAAYPYFSNQAGRKTYTKYDLALTSGEVYRITATVPDKYKNTAQMMIVLYDQGLVDAYDAQTSSFNTNAHTAGDGWTALTHDISARNTASGSAVGCILSFRQSSSNPTISSDFTVSVTVEKSGTVVIEPEVEDYINRAVIEGVEHNIRAERLDELNKYIPQKWSVSNFFNAVTISKPKVEKMAHTPNVFEGNDGYLYVTYYANHTSDYEGITGDIISKVAKISQCNLYDSEVAETLRKGQDFGSFVQSTDYAPYDQILIPKTDNVFSYVFVATPQGGVPTVATIDLDKSTLNIGDSATFSDFRYKKNGVTQTVIMNTNNLDTFVRETLGLSSKTIGTYMILTKPVLYNGEWYTYMGGLQSQSQGDGFGGCIIKTADYGKTWDFVAYNDNFTGTVVCMWEGALDISSEGMAYCMLRAVVSGSQFGSGLKQRAVVVTYNIETGVWGDYKVLTGTINDEPADSKAGIYLDDDGNYAVIEVDDSRPFVFVSDDYVYMLQNIKPRMKTAFDETGAIRSTLQIWKYDTEMNLIDFYRIRNDASIQYFSIVDSKGRIYICFTEDKQHLNFALKGDIAVMPIDLQSLEKHGW